MGKKVRFFYLCLVMGMMVLGRSGELSAFDLNVTIAGSGSGTVTSRPAGIKCGSDCTQDYAAGKKVALKAKADNDSSFAGWAGGGCTGIDPCSVTMDSEVEVVATFDAKTPEISLLTDKLEFEVEKPGKKVTNTLVISNIGTGNLIVTVSGLEETDFSISGKSTFTIRPGKSYKLKVNCVPSAFETVATEEFLSGAENVEEEREDDVEEDIEPSPEGTSAVASGAGRTKMRLETNDPKHPDVDVDLIASLTVDKNDFINVPTWQLDITWSAKDAYVDDFSYAELEMTATARYILKQTDKRSDIGWAKWEVQSVQSWNMTLSGFSVEPPNNHRTDYSATNQLLGAEGAVFQVGSFYNPSGYELLAHLDPIVKVTGNPAFTETSAALLTEDVYKPPPSGFCIGPLPPSSLTIHGSLVIPLCVPPICGHRPTQVGIQYVLQPYGK